MYICQLIILSYTSICNTYIFTTNVISLARLRLFNFNWIIHFFLNSKFCICTYWGTRQLHIQSYRQKNHSVYIHIYYFQINTNTYNCKWVLSPIENNTLTIGYFYVYTAQQCVGYVKNVLYILTKFKQCSSETTKIYDRGYSTI